MSTNSSFNIQQYSNFSYFLNSIILKNGHRLQSLTIHNKLYKSLQYNSCIIPHAGSTGCSITILACLLHKILFETNNTFLIISDNCLTTQQKFIELYCSMPIELQLFYPLSINSNNVCGITKISNSVRFVDSIDVCLNLQTWNSTTTFQHIFMDNCTSNLKLPIMNVGILKPNSKIHIAQRLDTICIHSDLQDEINCIRHHHLSKYYLVEEFQHKTELI